MDVFTAIAHPIRRRILSDLEKQGPLTLTRIASNFDESRQAIRKHIGVLSDANLVRLKREGREQRCALHAERLAEIQQWVNLFEAHWDTKLAGLKAFVETNQVATTGTERKTPKSQQRRRT